MQRTIQSSATGVVGTRAEAIEATSVERQPSVAPEAAVVTDQLKRGGHSAREGDATWLWRRVPDLKLKGRLGTVLAGVAMVAAAAVSFQGSAQAAPALAAAADVPAGPLRVTTNAGSGLLGLKAGADTDGDFGADVTLGTLFPNQATPSSMIFHAPPASNGRVALLSGSVSVGFGISCLDVENDSNLAGARIVLRQCDGTLSQEWDIRNRDPIRPQTRALQNAWSGLFLDAGGNPVAGSGPTQQPGPVNEDRQRWFARPA